MSKQCSLTAVASPVECRPTICLLMFCEYGHQYDPRGCPICACNVPPRCRNRPACMYTLHQRHRNFVFETNARKFFIPCSPPLLLVLECYTVCMQVDALVHVLHHKRVPYTSRVCSFSCALLAVQVGSFASTDIRKTKTVASFVSAKAPHQSFPVS